MQEGSASTLCGGGGGVVRPHQIKIAHTLAYDIILIRGLGLRGPEGRSDHPDPKQARPQTTQNSHPDHPDRPDRTHYPDRPDQDPDLDRPAADQDPDHRCTQTAPPTQPRPAGPRPKAC